MYLFRPAPASIPKRKLFDADNNNTKKPKLSSWKRKFESSDPVPDQSSPVQTRESKRNRTTTILRTFSNQDLASCWMNSCLQSLLCVLDNVEELQTSGTELWESLFYLKNQAKTTPIDPGVIKEILYRIEKQRIIYFGINPESRLFHFNMTNALTFAELNMVQPGGQQDCKDFFLCLAESKENWDDIYSLFKFSMKTYTVCSHCGESSSSGVVYDQMILNLNAPTEPVPINNHIACKIKWPTVVSGWRDEDGCNMVTDGQNFTKITDVTNMEFLIVIIERLTVVDGTPQINKVKTPVDEKLVIHDMEDNSAEFQPISVIHHTGYVTGNRDTRGHYRCDIYDVGRSQWYQTSDEDKPLPISKPADNGYIIIYKRLK